MPAQQILLGLGAKDYEVKRSLRFNDDDSPYLSRTPSSAGNRRTYTISVWAKIIDNGTYRAIIGAGGGTSRDRLQIFNDDKLVFNLNDGSGGDLRTTQLLRDPNAWYHIVVGVDTTQSTASDRIKLYLNGSQVTSFSTENYPSQNYDCKLNNNIETFIGQSSSNNFYFEGYLAEFNFIDGSQLTPSSFGETNSKTDQWVPKKFSGSYGTNGFYLNFSDNSNTTAATLGKDSSGNGHNFTPNNLATGDSVKDSPTNNFCTLNINDNNLSESSPHFVYSEGNLKAAWSFTGTNFDRAYGTLFVEGSDTNKYYWEATGTQNNEQMQWGVHGTHISAYEADNRNTNSPASADMAVMMWQPYGSAPYLYGFDASSGTYGDLLSTSNGNPANGDIFGFVFDGATGKFYVWFKGVELSGQDYSAGTSVFDAVDSTKTYAIHSMQGDGGVSTKSGNFVMNWGQDSSFAGAKTAQGNTDANGIGDFYYSVPSGAKALCSKNLLEPTIAFPDEHFDTLIWTGTAASHTLTGLNFQPDLFWAKSRSQSYHHTLIDSVRGTNKQLWSNRTNDEQTDTSFLTSFNSNGVTLGDNSSGSGATNTNGHTYVGWNWKAGGSASSNGDGSITSSVSANTTAGFSIVSYSGNGTDGATVGHGLGVAPDCIIIKSRNLGTLGTAAAHWSVSHKSLTGGLNGGSSAKKLYLSLTNAESANSHGAVSAVSSTTFTLKTGSGNDADAHVNDSSGTYIAYCFSEVAGFSKFGSYEGNQNADGPFVYLGFTPAWIMIKNADNASNRQWCIIDATRTTINKSASAEVLFANDSQSESVANNNYGQFASKPAVDILSNGFKVREGETAAYTQLNRSNTHIFLAFAESPFKYARAR